MPTHNPSQPKLGATRVALTGYMGAGKSTVGRIVAARLGWAFYDLDEEIERRQRMKIREFFSQHGEPAFRAVESEVLREVLASRPESVVIALGGGTFIQQANAAMLGAAKVRVIFLEAAIEDLEERCRASGDCGGENLRPLAADSSTFRTLYAERLPLYRAADYTVRTTGTSLDEIVAGMLRLLHR